MTKSIRKYKGWLMAGFTILLMMAWLIDPGARAANDAVQRRVVATLDGQKITAADQARAMSELDAFRKVLPGLFENGLGVGERDWTHWLMLAREAEAAGFVGEAADGEEFLPALAREMIQADPRLQMQLRINKIQTNDEGVKYVVPFIRNAFHGARLNDQDMNHAMAKLRGVDRLMRAYRVAPRVSDRRAAATAKHELDSAVADMVFIDAEATAAQIAEPDEAALRAQLDQFKAVKPGEGEFGIGYLLPRRVKLEWLTLNHAAFEAAVQLDPIEVRKRYAQNTPGMYPGDYATERARVEKDMRSEAADKAMQEAHVIVQREVMQATRQLATDGQTKYKVLPADWGSKRPTLEAIAQAVAAEMAKAGLKIPLPEVMVRAGTWVTEAELSQLPGIGMSSLRQGGSTRSFPELVSWTRELEGSEPGAIAIQLNIPAVEAPLTDFLKNRYYMTILATRGESAPDGVDDIRETLVKDYKRLRAYDALKARLDEFRAAAVAGGLEAVVAAATPPAPIIADPTTKDAGKPEIRSAVRFSRAWAGDPRVDEEPVRLAVVSAAAALDPLAPYGSAEAERAMVAAACPKRLGVAVFKVLAYIPLTQEAFRQNDVGIVNQAQRDVLAVKPGSAQDPFSMMNMLKRHEYMIGKELIRTVEQLRKDDREA
jgi:hypothetical protein